MIALKKAGPQAKKWRLDTIKEETKLCYLYEKLGLPADWTGSDFAARYDDRFYKKLQPTEFGERK